MAPSITIGAVILLRRKAATKVIVCHSPNGTSPTTLTPRGARPLSRTIFVLTAVASINTSRAGSSMPCSRIQRRRARATSARCRSAACRLFFKGDVVPDEKTRKRALAGSNSSLEQLHKRLLQGQIRPLGNECQNPLRVRFQRRYTASARLRRRTPALVPALQPFDRRTHTDVETLGRLVPRRALDFHGFDDAFPQVTRIRLWHRPPPEKENQCPKTRSSLALWESHRFNSVGNRFSLRSLRKLDCDASRSMRAEQAPPASLD